ncbi:MAG: hypothetical protein DMF68_03315 [Acidobacteria bacterium]|nr:MAG: hypothetical protein DMF68_03315 [Acidobacteriota bacterium]
MNRKNQWTLIFYFAGDNLLSPGMVSQLKAIKDAGFQEDTRVLVYFDPGEKGASTRLFEVNRQRKQEKRFQIGDGANPFVRNLIEDGITAQTLEARERELKTASRTSAGVAALESLRELKKELTTSDTTSAVRSLTSFLSFCVNECPAEHYMVFLVGHGMIVGNDAFLPDEHPNTAIKLKQLGNILRDFTENVNHKGGTFELLGLHSCSMSAVEVAYELKDTANYMMATEGSSFVGSWPYRQLLKKFFNTMKQAKRDKAEVDVKMLIRKLYELSLYNSTDFMFAGFSADISLCNLNGAKVTELTEPLVELTKALRRALPDEREKQRILLAHLKSQSYWEENYTDLYDFCHCLSEMYDKEVEKDNPVRLACDEVINRLDARQRSDAFDALIVFSDHFGPTYQYSHGLSIYFPWSEPIADGTQDIMRNYRSYAFTKELKSNSWDKFLKDYFDSTKRELREEEDYFMKDGHKECVNRITFVLDGSAVSDNSTSAGGTILGKPNPADSGGKPNPADSGSSDCSCGSVKNYDRRFSLSRRAYKAFRLRGRKKS